VAAAPFNPKAGARDASLAIAMVCSSVAPLLLLDDDARVIAASVSFCEAFGLSPSEVADNSLFALGAGEWDVPQLRVLVSATASGDAEVGSYRMELGRGTMPVRSLDVSLRKLNYGEGEPPRLLLAIVDVTEALAKDTHDRAELHAYETRALQLEYDNRLLLQEVRHRIANSLQIIASVMMLSARRTQSEETRGHLRDAHNRVMSIADLQQQLAVSTVGAVNIRSYLTKLCATIAASMIADPDLLPLTATAPDLEVDAEVSVSLGLIVTELVINALKHGFPDHGEGRIDVTYTADGGAWTLRVSDSGVGMPPSGPLATAGLGTSIVRALARQLRARVEVAPGGVGTCVSIIHAPVSGYASADTGPDPPLAAV
jgi:two-component system, sensor histidine kinase PdtaS